MVKILDKLLAHSGKLTKARQNYDWIKEELLGLEERINTKKQVELDRFVVRANKQLAKLGYTIDKSEYVNALIEEKLQRFDVKNYMNHRALKHGDAKAIFKAIKAGNDWQSILPGHNEKYKKLIEKRANYASKVNELSNNSTVEKVDSSAYDRLKNQLLAEYEAFKATVDKKYEGIFQKEKARLENKLTKAEEKINLIKSKVKVEKTLEPDVLLEVKNLKMYFGGLKAVDDLSFNVKKGEIFGLIGPNGAGKTTVFNCITRFYDATGGDMYFENKYGEVVNMRDFKVHDVLLQGISRTFQNIELVKEVSVLENLLVAATRTYRSGFAVHALGLPSLKKEEKMLRQKAMRILKFMQIEQYAGWIAMGLPYGILKKVEIARALMADANLIIMDEPAAGLNDVETIELTEIIRKIRDTFGVTILLVEHDMKLVMSVCDNICAISFGQLLAIGTPEEIQSNKAVQEAYLGVEEDE